MPANISGITVASVVSGSSKPVFTWYPDAGAAEEIKPSVNATKFGDGYEQRVALGSNPDAVTWTLSFTGTNTLILPIRDFLKTQDALGAFQWINPFGELGLYVCRSWTSSKPEPSIVKIDAKFEKVYEANV